MDIKDRMLQDIKDSIDAAQKMLSLQVSDLNRIQSIATQLAQANNTAQQLYGILYKEWADQLQK